jgi:hypothetical protein
MAVVKKMRIGERVGFEIRFEGYNILNHPQFFNPGTSASGNQLNQPNFGVITSTLTHSDGTTSARQIKVAAKLTF